MRFEFRPDHLLRRFFLGITKWMLGQPEPMLKQATSAFLQIRTQQLPIVAVLYVQQTLHLQVNRNQSFIRPWFSLTKIHRNFKSLDIIVEHYQGLDWKCKVLDNGFVADFRKMLNLLWRVRWKELVHDLRLRSNAIQRIPEIKSTFRLQEHK